VDYESYYLRKAPSFDALRLDRAEEIGILGAALQQHLPSSARILDVGCGTGRYGAWFVKRGHTVTGVDVSAAQLTHAHGLSSTVHASITALPFPDSTFDACLMSMMVHQIPQADRPRGLAECFRVLQPGACLLLKTAGHDDLAKRQLAQWFPSALRINLERYPSIPMIVTLMHAARFQVESIEPTHTTVALPRDEYIEAIRRQHNTTLAALPPSEFAAGVQLLERDAAGWPPTVTHHHWHTVILARRPQVVGQRRELPPRGA